ncbi:MAG: TPM domain-containing protein [Candidatus Aminicenantes bacterium]|nr:TPM domain-containing protein [Candidatus Aminicenantes bacterium]
MSKITFKPENLEKINNAVKKAERKTIGEISLAFIKESHDYAAQELMLGIIFGFLYFFTAIFFLNHIENVIQELFWDYSVIHLLLFYGLSTFLVIFIGYMLANIPFVNRLIVSKKLMKKKVNERAVRYFMESGVYNTRERTGILIFMSLLERRVELLADRGISKKISQRQWDSIIQHIITGIKTKQFIQNCIEAIASCGKILAEHFPARLDDINELGDDMEILEK